MLRIKNDNFGTTFSQEEIDYGYYYDEKEKKRVFGKVGTRNVYVDIQSHANETDMKFIKQLLLDGGAPALTPDMYGDVSHISNDLLDNLMQAEYARDCFKSLPSSIKEKYSNDFYTFARDFKMSDFDEMFKKSIEANADRIVREPAKKQGGESNNEKL